MVMMKGITANSGITPAPDSHGAALHDHLRLPDPDGRKVGDVKDITPALVALGIPGATYEAGRAANIDAYAAHLARIHDEGGRLAVARYLASGKAQ